ncbi:protein S100-A10 isoform 2-T2 [Chlamydotis macqueenii]
MPSQMEQAMETLLFTFHKYAGDKEHLGRDDLRALMEKELPGFLEVGLGGGTLGPIAPGVRPHGRPGSSPIAPQTGPHKCPGTGPHSALGPAP